MTACASGDSAQAARAVPARLAGPRLGGSQGLAAAVTLERFLLLIIGPLAAVVLVVMLVAVLGGC